MFDLGLPSTKMLLPALVDRQGMKCYKHTISDTYVYVNIKVIVVNSGEFKTANGLFFLQTGI